MSTGPDETTTGTSPLSAADLAALEPADFSALRVAVGVEEERRRDLERVPEQVAFLEQKYEAGRSLEPSRPTLVDAVAAVRSRWKR